MLKAILLALGAYVLTLMAALVLAVIMLAELSPRGCGAVSQILSILWGTVAVLFVLSIIAVGFATWKLLPGRAGRVAILGAYTLVLLASYLVIAFGMMIALNC
ncbi:MAG TPA: hypothetical protein DCL15_12730 [Chloroflexi bacterium]|nr:hypothetical protein [Chloroflexota bacterium]HHW84749.1 hypothetical protein [Chloroflexota bacterium]